MRGMKKKRGKRARVRPDLAGAAAGAAVGAVAGAIAGPAGIVVGAVAGAAAGVVAREGLAADLRDKAAVDKQLDKEIGVTEGDLGAPNLKHPPAKVGAYSASSSGGGGGERHPAEGPIEPPDD